MRWLPCELSHWYVAAGRFIGRHLVNILKTDRFWVRGVDLKNHEYAVSETYDFVIGDLRDPNFRRQVIDRRLDEVYQLTADMGGAQNRPRRDS